MADEISNGQLQERITSFIDNFSEFKDDIKIIIREQKQFVESQAKLFNEYVREHDERHTKEDRTSSDKMQRLLESATTHSVQIGNLLEAQKTTLDSMKGMQDRISKNMWKTVTVLLAVAALIIGLLQARVL